MRCEIAISILTVLAGLGSGACARVSPSDDDDGGVGGAISGLRESRVTWDQHGVIDSRFGIAGFWYSYNDCDSPMRPAGLACTEPDPALIGPDGLAGWSASAEQVCMKGIAPRVEKNGPDMTLAYSFQWGAGMGFGLANGNPAGYDAAARLIQGFMFDITEGTSGDAAPPTLRISLGTPTTEENSAFITVLVPARDQPVLFSEVEQGAWEQNPTAFTPDAITGITFDVYTNDQAPKPYDFCVSNFRVLK